MNLRSPSWFMSHLFQHSWASIQTPKSFQGNYRFYFEIENRLKVDISKDNLSSVQHLVSIFRLEYTNDPNYVFYSVEYLKI